MDIEKIINDEVERKVAERLKECNADRKIDFYEDKFKTIENLKKEVITILNKAILDIDRKITEYEDHCNDMINNYKRSDKNKKCNFPNCDNYKEGMKDTLCEKCGNYNKENSYQRNPYLEDEDEEDDSEYDMGMNSSEILAEMLRRLSKRK